MINIYTKEMYEAGELPKVGMKCSFFAGMKLGGGDFVEGTCLSVAKKSNGENVIMFEYTHNGSMSIDCTIFSNEWVKPIDKRTDKEKAIDDLNKFLGSQNRNDIFHTWSVNFLSEVKSGKIHGITFTGDK